MFYSLGIAIGLTVTDIDNMTAGEIVDLAYYRANQADKRQERKPDTRRKATQADYDSF